MSPSVLSVIEGQQVTLPCMLLAGNPLPERQWLHNYGLVRLQRMLLNLFHIFLLFYFLNHFNIQILQVTSDHYVTVRRDGSLHIERVRLDDAGDYTCLAENVIGATNHTTAVNVYGTLQKL